MGNLKDIWKALRRKPMSLIGFGLIGFFLLVAAAAPVLAPVPPGSRDAYLIPQDGYSPDPVRPSAKHRFGTTEQQYALYYGMVWGTRTAFKVALFVVATSLLIGVLFGGAADFYGGWIDEALMRFTDVVLAFPDLVLAVVIVSVTRPSLFNVMVSVMLVSWPSYARLLRGDVLSIKERDFVAAARALGASDARILFRHIVPNCIYPLLVVASLSMGRIVITAAARPPSRPSCPSPGVAIATSSGSVQITMAESFLKNQRRLIACAAHLNGEYGLKDLYIGVPAIIGGEGLEKIVEVALTAEEKTMLAKSADAVRELVEAAKKL